MFYYRGLKFNYEMLLFSDIHPIVFLRNLLARIYIISNMYKYWALNNQSNEIGIILLPLSLSEMTAHVV